jgi:hypothetical protein
MPGFYNILPLMLNFSIIGEEKEMEELLISPRRFLCPILLKFMLRVLDAHNVFVHVLLMCLKWFLGTVVKLDKLLLPLELKIV